MLTPKPLDAKNTTLFTLAITLASVLILPACTVKVDKAEGNQQKKVDIETPVGGLHVSKGADVRDTGLTVYPGAREKQSSNDHDEKSANVNISSDYFGLKVIAIEFESDDAPEKVIAYYQDQLKKYGHVIQCRTNKHGNDFSVKADDDSDLSREVTCESGNSGDVIELKVGMERNQHVVSVQPRGKGTDFALVYIQMRGKKDAA
jgi:hypothetical protein